MTPEDTEISSCADTTQLQTSDTEATQEELSFDKVENNQQESFQEEEIPESELKVESQQVKASEIDQALYNEVLEKLDIIKREKPIQEIQEKPKQESQVKNEIEQALAQDFAKIQKLTQSGIINSAQGQNLKKEVLKKAFDKLVQTEKIKRSSPVAQPIQNNGLEEFSKNNPDFFISDGRKDVLDYLKSGNANVGKDELNKISNIVRTVEKAAIDRYLKKVTHEKTLRDSNEVAKQRLTANAQKLGFSDKNLSRTFTREQIGKMSSAEFTKYESVIMGQLKKGLIK